MKLSENENYLRYMQCYANDDYRRAREALQDCMNDLVAGEEYESSFRAFLLQQIADLFLMEGAENEARRHHQEALRIDPKSLLVRLQYSKFLGKIGSLSEAIAECDKIMLEGKERPFPKTEGDFGSDFYTREAHELRENWLKSR